MIAALLATLRLPWKAALLALVLYAALMGVILFWQMPHAAGALPLDLRFPTYSLAAAEEYLWRLPPVARDILVTWVFWLDTAFPPALGLALILWLRNWRVPGAEAAPVTYVCADWAENLVTRRILTDLPSLPDLAFLQVAQSLTLVKYLALLSSVALLIWGVVREGRHGQGRQS
ncbi:hypothetical protein [Pseudaestuariivita sp.]|uniref:hypothetical protein n=1 Tax=Pseudaestuariivita sp. TaxID=2211669 RepID=UPI004059FBC0